MLKNEIDLHKLVVHGCLFKLYDQMLGEINIVNVLHNSTEVVRQALDAERATTYLVRQDTQELESAAIIGNVARTIRVPIRENSLAGYCALTGKAFLIPNAYGDLSGVDPKLRFDKSWDELNHYRTRSVLCAPAIFKDEVMGVIQVINRKDGAFQEDDLAPLKSVGRFVAYALYHARMYDELSSLKGIEKEKAEFMQVMVHELKSPVIASKMIVSGLLQFAQLGNSKAISALTKVERYMEELLNLVEDILNLSRIKSGKLLSEIVVCDLVVETENICERYCERARAKGLDTSLDLSEKPVFVRIDLYGYQIIVSNLVSNAVKYTSTGSLNVTLRQEGRWGVLRVKDTGMGIPEDEIPHVFNEFFRASNAINSQIEGSGVGLAGAKELVERFGGEMELETQENKGSLFTVRLPLHKA